MALNRLIPGLRSWRDKGSYLSRSHPWIRGIGSEVRCQKQNIPLRHGLNNEIDKSHCWSVAPPLAASPPRSAFSSRFNSFFPPFGCIIQTARAFFARQVRFLLCARGTSWICGAAPVVIGHRKQPGRNKNMTFFGVNLFFRKLIRLILHIWGNYLRNGLRLWKMNGL